MQNERKRKKSKIFALAVVALMLLFSGAITLNLFGLPTWEEIFCSLGLSDISQEINSYELKVRFFDVGKADSILISCGNDDVLIDAGIASSDKDIVQSIQKQGVDKLEKVVNTHPDKDHIGQMANVISEIPVDEFDMSEIPQDLIPQNNTYERMIFALENKNIPIRTVKSGDDLSLGNMKIDVVAPVKQYKDTNNNSVVLKLSYKNDSIIFMGDAEKEAEKDIIATGQNLRADLMKVGHHGSKTSTTQDLIDAVLPKFAVISVGEDKNNLPKQEILDRLTNNNVEVFRTDLSGDITAVSNGSGIKIIEEK